MGTGIMGFLFSTLTFWGKGIVGNKDRESMYASFFFPVSFSLNLDSTRVSIEHSIMLYCLVRDLISLHHKLPLQPLSLQFVTLFCVLYLTEVRTPPQSIA